MPRWIWPAVGGGALLVIGLVVVLLGSSGNGGDEGGLVALASEPAAGTKLSWMPSRAVPVGNEADWKVRPDPVKAAPPLAPAFPVFTSSGHAVVFSDPAVAQAAVFYQELNPPGLRWDRYDLRTPAFPRRLLLNFFTPLSPDDWRRTALSPSGERVAFGIGEAVTLFSGDGTSIGTLQPSGQAGEPVTWVGFAAEDRLLAIRGGRLSGHDLATGGQTYEATVSLKGPPILSPGRKWIAGFTGTGFEFFTTANGARAGNLLLPDDFLEGKEATFTSPRLAVSPDGKRLAGIGFNKMNDVLVAVWDLTNGRPLESLVLPWLHTQEEVLPPLIWCSERQLLFAGGRVLDLDLRTWICKYPPGMFGALMARPMPDGRRWMVMGARAPALKAIKAKLGIDFPPITPERSGQILSALTVPHREAIADIESARAGGTIWHPGVAVRVELDSSCPNDQRKALLTAVSSALTQNGFRVDPSAAIRTKVTPKVQDAKVAGETVSTDLKSNKVYYKIVAGLAATLDWEVTDAAGHKLFTVPWPKPVQVAGDDAAARKQLWNDLCAAVAKVAFPRLHLSDAAGAVLQTYWLNSPIREFSSGIDDIEQPELAKK